jgi:SAM-dependent methyltransferase
VAKKLEGPQLGIKTLKGKPGNWLSRGLGDTSKVLSMAMLGEEPFFSSAMKDPCWEHFMPGHLNIDAPDASFDAVYLTGILNRYSPEDQKKLIAEAARVTKNGGRVVAYSPACDDAQEALDLATDYGLDTTEFVSRRLTNRDIARLRPHEASFFQGKVVVPSKERLITVMKGFGLEATLEHMWQVKDRFAIKRFHVGMSWTVSRT